MSTPDRPILAIAPQFRLRLADLPGRRHREEVAGTLRAVARGWCPLRHEYLNIHSYEWQEILNPPYRMLVGVGQQGQRQYVLAIDLFVIRSYTVSSPQERLEAAQWIWNASRP